MFNLESKTIIYSGFINFMFSLFSTFSFSFEPLAAIFGIGGLVGFIFFVKAANGESSINTGPKKDWDASKMEKE